VAQKQHYAAEYPSASHDMIYLEQTPVGRIYVDRDAEALHILDITVLPEHRCQGTDRWCCAGFSMRRAKLGSRLRSMWKVQSSLRLFERLGFRKELEKGFHLLMSGRRNLTLFAPTFAPALAPA